jgi:hypothetical protein
MKLENALLVSELQALVEGGRNIRRVPDVVRARALARARATLAVVPSVPEPAPEARGRGLRLALAASVALAVGASAAVAALRTGALRDLAAAPRSRARAVSTPRIATLEGPTVALKPKATAKRQRLAGSAHAPESYAAELELLERAQAAYAGRDFLGALVVISEHARRFPGGRLAEEREALRVRSLAGSGHPDEARRASGAFGERFPRSVLLPRLQEASEDAE